jgi:hypothetical protein
MVHVGNLQWSNQNSLIALDRLTDEEMERENIRIATEQSNKMTKESGIQTSVIKEIENYLEQVIKEVKEAIRFFSSEFLRILE